MASVGIGLINPKATFLDDNGHPIALGFIYHYVPGTTTPRDTYTDVLLTVPNANPVALDAAGRATIFYDPTLSYKIVVKSATLVTIYTQDNVVEPNQGANISLDGTTWTGRVLSVMSATAGIGLSLTGDSFTTTLNKAASGTHPGFTGTLFSPPTIGGGGATVTAASTVTIDGAPTGGVSNYSLLVQGVGVSQFQGAVQLYTAVDTGLSFDDSRVSGVVGTTVTAYIGSLSNKFTVRSDSVVFNTNAAAGDLFAFKNANVAHGFTTDTGTANFGILKLASFTEGGVALNGYTEGVLGMSISANYTTGNTTKDATGSAAVIIRASKLSGSTAGAMGANDNLLALQNFTGTRLLVDAEGDLLYDGAAPANYDTWDDVGLTRALDQTFRGSDFVETTFDAFVQHNRADLERAGIVTEGGFVNLTKHTRLLNGTVWQLFLKIQELSGRIAELEAA